jgi:uncharacterized RDD family membrane protein YckC
MSSPRLINENTNTCSFLRRLAAIFYDSLLLCAVFFCATYILISTTSIGAIESDNLFFKMFLLILAYFYFCWHWVKGRQTLGMRSWFIFVINNIWAWVCVGFI